MIWRLLLLVAVFFGTLAAGLAVAEYFAPKPYHSMCAVKRCITT